jgi:hypothetical protein
MADNKTIAEQMKFFWRFNKLANSAVCGISLRKGTQFGLFALVAIEALWLMIFPGFTGMGDFSLIYVVMWTLARLAVLICCQKAASGGDFDKCLKATYAIQTLTICNLVNTCVTLIAMGGAGRLFGVYVPHIHEIESLVPLAAFVCLNLYVTYLMFSFTKHLGLENLEIIDGVQSALIPNAGATSDYRNITTLVIGQNPTVTDINSLNTAGQFTSLDKVVLNDPRDIQFAQSAQQAVVNGMTLPSGVRIPVPSDSRTWRIVGSEILLA